MIRRRYLRARHGRSVSVRDAITSVALARRRNSRICGAGALGPVMSSAPSNRLTRDRGWARGGQESAGASGGCAGGRGRYLLLCAGLCPGQGQLGPCQPRRCYFSNAPLLGHTAKAQSLCSTSPLCPALCPAPPALPAPLRSASCLSFPSEQRSYSSPERVISLGPGLMSVRGCGLCL